MQIFSFIALSIILSTGAFADGVDDCHTIDSKNGASWLSDHDSSSASGTAQAGAGTIGGGGHPIAEEVTQLIIQKIVPNCFDAGKLKEGKDCLEASKKATATLSSKLIIVIANLSVASEEHPNAIAPLWITEGLDTNQATLKVSPEGWKTIKEKGILLHMINSVVEDIKL